MTGYSLWVARAVGCKEAVTVQLRKSLDLVQIVGTFRGFLRTTVWQV